VTRTHYDLPGALASFAQNNLRGRVSYTENDAVSTYYDYDIVGNVKNLMHDVQGFAQKRIGYDYDLISGKVNEVRYQDGQADAFYHRYKYDADNRLTEVYTSRDHYIWEHDARYLYYAHGPLARVELGNDKVAGNDYRYTLQGWIHGVNTPGQNLLTQDAGQDGAGQAGAATNANRWFSRDEYSYALGYHRDAYKPIGGAGVNLGAAAIAATWDNQQLTNHLQGGLGLYNGNIAWMVTQLNEIGRQHLADPVATPSGGAECYVYKYDQLHRIKAMKSHGLDANGAWAADNMYGSAYSYDGNGNIRALERKAKGVVVDQLDYRYYSASANGAAHIGQFAPLGESNRLARVYDNSFGNPNNGSYTGAIAAGLTNAYEYDAIGNLVRDNTEGIANIAWNIQGKVDEITYTDPARPATRYGYDVGGNRLYKVSGAETSWYIRDASGNVMAIYTVAEEVTEDYSEQVTRLSEVPIYGSSRIGMERFERVLDVQRDWDGGSGNTPQDPTLLLRSVRLTELVDDSPLASQAGQYTGQYAALRNLGEVQLPLDSLELRVKDQPGAVSLAGYQLLPGEVLLVLHGVPQDQQAVMQVLELGSSELQNVQLLWQTTMPMPESGTLVLDLKAGNRRHLLDAALLGNINNPYRDPQTLNVLAARQTVLSWAQDTASLSRWQSVSSKDLDTYLEYNYATQLDKTLTNSSYHEGAVLLKRGAVQALELLRMDHQQLYYAEYYSWEFALAEGPYTYARVRGARVYEQSNHLGNVLTTLSDKVLGRLPGNAYVCSHYESIVVSATDYYPFGWEMPGRSVNKAGYRFGFNGKENDREEWGQQLVQDYGFRLYNPAIGKFLSVDPLTRGYPMLTPYQFASNTPIMAIDLDGLEAKVVVEIYAVKLPRDLNGNTPRPPFMYEFEWMNTHTFERRDQTNMYDQFAFKGYKRWTDQGIIRVVYHENTIVSIRHETEWEIDDNGNYTATKFEELPLPKKEVQESPFIVDGMAYPVLGVPTVAGTKNAGVKGGLYGDGRGTQHNGVDVSTSSGDPIFSMTEGTVVAVRGDIPAGTHGNDRTGNKVAIKTTRNGQTMRFLYIHLDGVLVTKGQEVKMGQQIGIAGTTGYKNMMYEKVVNEHVHIEVRVNGVLQNPQDCTNLKFDSTGNIKND
jgi:RHS repeat-associated protein